MNECKFCRFDPPSSTDGKPCTQCDGTNCYQERELSRDEVLEALHHCTAYNGGECDGCPLLDHTECEGYLHRELINAFESMKRDLKDCRNELCLKCGNYRMAHKGACDGCRWRDAV